MKPISGCCFFLKKKNDLKWVYPFQDNKSFYRDLHFNVYEHDPGTKPASKLKDQSYFLLVFSILQMVSVALFSAFI